VIPDNDLWIAATARQHELTLVSRDSHFSEIPDLYQESW
jgi:tRNA(fMet)-specific endonuclease VapC